MRSSPNHGYCIWNQEHFRRQRGSRHGQLIGLSRGDVIGIGQADDGIARLDAAAADDVRLFDDADREPRKVVFPGGIHARHLGRLPADQRAARLFAACRDSLDDLGRSLDVEPAAREIVEKE